MTVYKQDFLDFKLPWLPYKVFANIPYSIEGKIIRKLINANNPPEDCYLTMMREVAYRLAAPYKENQFSISHKPWFDFSIYHEFSKKDFTPYPSVESVIIRFTRKELPLLNFDEKTKYQRFIAENFAFGLPVFQHLKRKYGKNKAVKLISSISADKHTKPSYISLENWIKLYKISSTLN